tara:strand:+ start:36698 stop:37780 length:1083 start_codon:yes stop_codon:yes gene_type:complete
VFKPEALSSLINFQSTSVLLIFILQTGLRAGTRMHVYLGHEKTVDSVLSFINKESLKYFLLVSLLLGAIIYSFKINTDLKLYALFYLAQVAFGSNIGVSVARRKDSHAIFSSISAFINIFISCMLILTLKDEKLTYFLIELNSLIILFLQRLILQRNLQGSFKLTRMIIKRYYGMQTSAFLMYGTNYLFAQLIRAVGEVNSKVLIEYADTSILAGVLVLSGGQIFSFNEKKFIQEGSYFKIVQFLTIILTFIVTLYSGIMHFFFDQSFLRVVIIAFNLAGRLPFALCSQFANNVGRYHINILGALSLIMNGFLLYFNPPENEVFMLLLFFSHITAAFCFIILYKLFKVDNVLVFPKTNNV